MNENYAINNGSDRGPSFGIEDLIIWKASNFRGFYYDSSRSKKNSYEKPISKTENGFGVGECEVFQIIVQ
ncbi:hypothetical protein RhiirC2_764523 [Rhizophagus irregularis]|uniref:TLDc domain-containing protein n=1 Tax=Rhizophagus irregularis TaxID=588596 RepID=A0A2N1M2W0_9GLOM|nr:hypothetical protein RhiirC2_764523 [Rhizophagus irregularis]